MDNEGRSPSSLILPRMKAYGEKGIGKKKEGDKQLLIRKREISSKLRLGEKKGRR